jgi:LacI family transcriptional regulator
VPNGSAAPVTIYDVAARAGVSIATVSHALNRPDRVAEATRQRVIDTAEMLGFQPRGRGKAASTPLEAKRIAAIGPFSRHASAFERLTGILRQAAASFVDVIVLDRPPGDDPAFLESLRLRSRVDGIVIIGAEPSPEIYDRLETRRISAVLADRPSTRLSTVTVDDQTGGRLVAEHLLQLGCRSAVFVAPPPGQSTPITSGEVRLRSFAQALRAGGMASDVSWVVTSEGFEGGRLAARQIVQETLPDAIFGLHDQLACGIAVGLSELGVRLPQDVRLVGYDGTEMAAIAGLTTVRQPFQQTGAIAFDTLRSQILDPQRPPVHIELQPHLVVRRSTVAPDNPEQVAGAE